MSSRIGVGLVWRRAAVGSILLAAELLLTTCTGALLEPVAAPTSTLDDRLQLTGHVCTIPPNPNDFPVKVVFIVDESGSMCISDPPGSQQGNGFCEMPQVVATFPPGQTQPGRVKAILQLISQFQTENSAGQANVQIAILPFETSPMTPWPATGFAPPDNTAVAFAVGLESQLGNGTDTQGILEAAYALIASDIQATQATNPELLPRSRYEVVFLTDGTPFPHCTSATNLPPQDYATPEQPWLIWEDDSTYCTQGPPPTTTNAAGQTVTVDPGVCGSEVLCNGNGQPYTPGTDVNQNYQLFAAVKQIMTLKTDYNVGDLRIDTVMLLNQEAVTICGALCTDVYGIWPGLNPATYPAETLKAASWLLQQIATLGNGTFQAFTNGQIQNLSLAGLDYASLASPIVMKNLFVQSLSSIPTPAGRIYDSDGDGLPDTNDNTFTIGTNSFNADTVADCVGDQFKYLHEDEGFNPVCASPLGQCYVAGSCQGNANNGCTCSDGDGDGLPDCVEAILGSNPGLPDSDGDGIPDSVKARYGFNPTVWQLWQHQDTDGDGITDWNEFLANTDPTVPDADLYATDGYQYQITGTPQADGSTCYDFTVSNLKLLQTPSHTGQVDGYNLFKVWLDEAPTSSIATDYGYWRAACAYAQYSPPGVRVPAGPSLSLNPAGSDAKAGLFVDLHNFATDPYGPPTTPCAGVGPGKAAP
jgi:hypothetical protein